MYRFKLKNRAVWVALLFLATISGLGSYYATMYDFFMGAFFCSSLANGSVTGLILIPVVYFYEKKEKSLKITFAVEDMVKSFSWVSACGGIR